MTGIGTQMSEIVCKAVLDKCFVRLVEDMLPVPVLDTLQGENGFPKTTLRDIKEEQNTSEKNRKLVALVRTKGVHGYKVFIRCLNDTKQQDLTSHLTKVEQDELKNENLLNVPNQSQQHTSILQSTQQIIPQGLQNSPPLSDTSNISRQGEEIPLSTETSNHPVSKPGENTADTSLDETFKYMQVSPPKLQVSLTLPTTVNASGDKLLEQNIGADGVDSPLQTQLKGIENSPTPLAGVDASLTSTIFIDKCIHDGRLWKLSIDWVNKMMNERKPMDRGGYGDVYDCGWNNDLKMDLAMKMIDYTKDAECKRKSADNEIIASRVMHWAITPLLGTIDSKDNNQTYFLMPLLKNGNLLNAIKTDVQLINEESQEKLNWITRLKIIYQIASAIEYLHTDVEGFRGPIFHCDVSSNNIVLDENLNARLIDFGTNVALTQNQTSTRLSSTDQRVGKTGYMYTEQASKINMQNDWYAFALVMLEMVTSEEPRIILKALKEEKQIMRNFRDKIHMIWCKEGYKTCKDSEKLRSSRAACINEAPAQVASIALKTRIKPESELLTDIEKLVRTVYTNEKWSPSEKKRCVYCMVNPASDIIKETHGVCNMYICVACLRNSNLNPVKCHTCLDEIVSPIGTRWGAILIAGSDEKDTDNEKIFSDEMKELRKIFILKHPMVIGIREENVHCIHPEQDQSLQTMKAKVVSAFEMLSDQIEKDVIDTVVIYYSGHYSEAKGFRLDSSEDLFKKTDLQDRIEILVNKIEHQRRKQSKMKTVYVYLDCCSAPDVSNITKHDTSIIQINASKQEQSATLNKTGSLFTQLFMTALVGKAHNKQYFKHEQDCSVCAEFKCKNGLITMYDMVEYIGNHLLQANHSCSKPIINGKNIDKKAICIGYYIETETKMEFSVQHQDTTSFLTVDTLDSVERLKCSYLLPYLLENILVEKETFPTEHCCDIVAVSVKSNTKKEDGELDTIERIISAWNGKRPLYAGFRNLNCIDYGRVGRFLTKEENAQSILGYLQHESTEGFCSVEDVKKGTQTINRRIKVKASTITDLEDTLYVLEKNHRDCPNLRSLVKLFDELRINGLHGAGIAIDFPYLPNDSENVIPHFFVVSPP